MKWTAFSLCIAALLPTFAQIEPDQVFPRLIAHVPKLDQGFNASIFLKNDAAFEKGVYFTAYNEQGEALSQGDPQIFTIAAGTTQVLDGASTLPDGTSHFTVHQSSRVRVSMMYGTQIDQGGSQAVLHESNQAGRRFVIYPTGGNPGQGYWEGLALVNLGSNRTTIEFRLQDLAGNTIESTDRVLAPMAKLTTVLSDLFGPAVQTDHSQIELIANESVGLVMLSGNTQRHDLANVSPEPLPILETLIVTEDLGRLPKKLISIESLSFEEEIFTVSAVLPNPCHELELYWNGAVKESFPPQVDLYLVAREVGEICFQAIVKRTRSFDLTPLGKAFTDSGGTAGETLLVNILDVNHDQIFSTYQFVPFR